MKPTVCCLCEKSALDDSPNKKGDWVEFKNFQAQDSVTLTHPVGLEYFCSEHLTDALNLSGLNSDEALDELKSIFPCESFNNASTNQKESWWKRFIG